MMTTIDLGTELLIDRSTISDPYVRLAVASCGQAMVRGSQWVLVDKQLAVLADGSQPYQHLLEMVKTSHEG
jgi:hypothetical protein